MVSKKETTGIRTFVRGQLSDEPDLSTLTLGILKRRYLAQVGHKSLSPEARNYMKQVVEEELMKMQDGDSSGEELETKKRQNKRKRENENNEVISGGEDEDESKAKKPCHQSVLSSESEDEHGCKTGCEESEEKDLMKSGSEDGEQAVKKSKQKRNGGKQQINSEDSTDEEMNKSRKKRNDSSDRKNTPKSDEENESDSDKQSERSDKSNSNESSNDKEEEKNVPVEKEKNDSDSDSSSLPSLEDDKDQATEDKDDKKKKTMKKEREQSSNVKNRDKKAIVRLKRYIALCGKRQNYKKLLAGCRSTRSMVAVLNKELEDLGVEGRPTVQKCEKVRMMREEAKELAELDVNNIIATQGRSNRRRSSAVHSQDDCSSSTYQRTLNSDSDSNQENNIHRGRKRVTEWANLQGLISDDADSD